MRIETTVCIKFNMELRKLLFVLYETRVGRPLRWHAAEAGDGPYLTAMVVRNGESDVRSVTALVSPTNGYGQRTDRY